MPQCNFILITPRARDRWESAAFSNISLASSLYSSQAESTPAPSASDLNRLCCNSIHENFMLYCYICDKLSTSEEHVPPRSLFPESKDLPQGIDLRKNLITVPACDEHNLQKSGEDEYLLFLLVGNIEVNSAGLKHWQTKIRRALRKRSSKYSLFKNPRPIRFLGIQTGAYEIDFERMSHHLDLIARGLYFHHIKKHWPYAIQLAIPFAISVGSNAAQRYSQAMRETAVLAFGFLQNEPRLGDNPEVFYYQYKLKDDGPGFIMRMVFYGGIEVAALSNPESNSKEEVV